MKLIVGLGNPGLKYRLTRHNVGFLAVKELAKRHKIKINKARCLAKVGQGSINGQTVLLALPQTFMNVSGQSVEILFDSRGVGLEDLLVVCDDVNLKLGVLRIRETGSTGGHGGLESITEHLKTQDYARLRIGVGKEGLSGDITNFVLSNFTHQEQKSLKDILGLAAGATENWIKKGVTDTANKFNARNLW